MLFPLKRRVYSSLQCRRPLASYAFQVAFEPAPIDQADEPLDVTSAICVTEISGTAPAGRLERRGLRSGNQLVAPVNKPDDLPLRYGTVEKDGYPVRLVHVIGRQKSALALETFDLVRCALHVDYVDGLVTVQPQAIPRHVHDYGEPLAAIAFAQGRIKRIFLERIVGFGPKSSFGIIEYFHSAEAVHCHLYCDCVLQFNAQTGTRINGKLARSLSYLTLSKFATAAPKPEPHLSKELHCSDPVPDLYPPRTRDLALHRPGFSGGGFI